MAWDREKERKAAKKMSMANGIFGIVFIIVWCILAASMGAGIMLLFGIPFLGLMVYRLYVCIQLSKREETSVKQEVDPWERPAAPTQAETKDSNRFCPYCGTSLQETFEFCPKCGRKQV